MCRWYDCPGCGSRIIEGKAEQMDWCLFPAAERAQLMAKRAGYQKRWMIHRAQWIHYLSLLPYHKPKLPLDRVQVAWWEYLIEALLWLLLPVWGPFWLLCKILDALNHFFGKKVKDVVKMANNYRQGDMETRRYIRSKNNYYEVEAA